MTRASSPPTATTAGTARSWPVSCARRPPRPRCTCIRGCSPRVARSRATLAPLLVQALSRHPDIISMSAGTTLGPGEPPESVLSLSVFQQEYLANSNTILVCAAGNDGGAGPFLPASAGWPIAVGALNADKSLAGYSNRGPWVDVYARGTDVINAYPNGPYRYHEPPMKGKPDAHFTNGLASWSGTSFSTPLVSGLIAAACRGAARRRRRPQRP